MTWFGNEGLICESNTWVYVYIYGLTFLWNGRREKDGSMHVIENIDPVDSTLIPTQQNNVN